MERDYGLRETYGADSNPDRGPDVPERSACVLGRKSELIAYKLTLLYAGTHYYGWQKTAQFPTIQEELEKACRRIFQEEISCEAASRTDRGVHASGQIVHFFTSKRWSPHRVQRALNAVLPPDIRILNAEEAPTGFHPSLDAHAKTYRYHLSLGTTQIPFDRKISWHYPYPIDTEIMRSAAAQLIGTFDFGAFTTEKQSNNVRSLTRIELIEIPGQKLCIEMTADRFLYKMARTLVGTLANIGSGKLPLTNLKNLFTSQDRTLAGVTAPAHGLTLHQVHYN